jgi:Tfp pilus assembly pilus retraction ATPase PilT
VKLLPNLLIWLHSLLFYTFIQNLLEFHLPEKYILLNEILFNTTIFQGDNIIKENKVAVKTSLMDDTG